MTAQGRASARVGAVLLAAGASSRLGRPKQLLDFQGKPLVRHVAEVALASRARELIVVVGNQADAVTAVLEDLPVRIVENPRFLDGQSTSLRAGLSALPADLDAAIVLLVDQPFVDASLIDQLISRYETSGATIVAPEHAGRRGNPVVFDVTLLDELLEVTGDIGARDVIRRHRDDLVTVLLDDDKAFLDVDTWDDYQNLPTR